jgi:FAD/FMN-containing dehydrogenase
MMSIPPAPAFPPELRGRKVCALVWCNTAPGTACDAAVRVFRAERPLLDAVGELPYSALQRAFDPIAGAPARSFATGQCYEHLPAEAAADLIRFGQSAPTWQSFTHLYPVDGAAAEPSADATAWPWREARFVQLFLGSSPDPALDTELRTWTHAFSAALEPYGMGGTYSNFIGEGDAAVPDRAYGRHRERLAAAKRRYDPDNVFHVNVNVGPA